jgi:ATP-binding cassette subfamily B protein RaxB
VEGEGGIRQRGRNDCGPAALAHCLRRLGAAVAYPDPGIRVRPGPRGCRLDELAAEADRLGWMARARRADRCHLRRLRPPAILHVDGDHFVVLEGRERGRWLLHDPARGPVRCSARALTARWTGWVLEIGPRRPGPGSHPGPGVPARPAGRGVGRPPARW